MTCPWEGVDDKSDSMVCTLTSSNQPVKSEIPDWCPLIKVEVEKNLMTKIDSLLSCLRYHYSTTMQTIGEYQEICDLHDAVTEYTRN